MADRYRAVFDTNVYVSAFLSQSPTSPTSELIRRWEAGEFVLLVSDAIMDEVSDKLIEHGVEQERIIEFLALVERLAEWVETSSEAVTRVIEADPDDDLIVACAVTGKADYLVSYDPHFDTLNGEYQSIKIVKALPFLWAVRGDQPPEAQVPGQSAL